jgi:hypothetical protein
LRFLESYPGERFLAEFILSLTEGLGMTSKYGSCHPNQVRDLSLNEPLTGRACLVAGSRLYLKP